MNEKKNKHIAKVKDLRFWLVRAIWCLGSITLAGIALGGILFSSIRKSSGWNGQDQVKVYSKEQIDKFITSVLIVIQNQPLNQQNAKADMVFIASFNAFEQRLTMVALDSGTMVDVEGYEQKSLGEAYALGGPGLLVNSINQNFGLDLQSYACSDSHSMAAMIDLLGGIPAELTPDEANYINDALGENGKNLQSGSVTLTGVQSMVHAMDNLSDQIPLGSQERSLSLVQSAILNMRKTATKEAMLPLLSLVFSSIQTNLDLTALHDWGYEVLKADEIEYQSLVLPCENSYTGIPGEKLQADITRNAELLRDTLYNAQ